jgi:uncharacterized protein (TIGR02001 family)
MKFRYGNVVLGVAAAMVLSSNAFAGGPGEDETEESPGAAPPVAEVAVVEEEEGFLGDWLPGGFSGSVSLMSDYSFRGISQTQTGFAAQGGATYKSPIGIYLGTWASSVNFVGNNANPNVKDDDTYLEQDFFGGYTNTWGGFTLDTSATFLWYPKESDYNYWEFAVKGAYNVMDVATVKAGFIYGPDYFGYAGDGFIFTTGFSIPIPLPENKYIALTLDSNLGYTHATQFIFGTHNNYLDWNTGLVVGVHKNLSFDLRYVDTDIGNSANELTDARFVGGATFSF